MALVKDILSTTYPASFLAPTKPLPEHTVQADTGHIKVLVGETMKNETIKG